MEDLFARAAEKALPASAEIYRPESGNLVYHWRSPCERMGGLWVTIGKREIMLSTKLSHTHVDQTEFLGDKVPQADLPARIVEQAVREAEQILTGATVFIKTFDPEGREDSSSGMSPRPFWTDPQDRLKWTASHGPGWVARAWDWFGEVIGD
jgi:hypothetical protein